MKKLIKIHPKMFNQKLIVNLTKNNWNSRSQKILNGKIKYKLTELKKIYFYIINLYDSNLKMYFKKG